MPKYYVESGELKVTIDRPDVTTAVHDAFKLYAKDCEQLGLVIQANETGKKIKDDTVFFSTMKVLETTNLENLFVFDTEELNNNE